MILDDTKILSLIKEPSNPNIKEWKEEHTTLDLYVNGGDVSAELEQVKNFENKHQKKLRDDIARSTKDLVSYLINPIGKVFSASGFISEYEIATASNKIKFEEHLERLPEGISMRKWMRTYWLEAFLTDPNGVLLIENENIEENPKAYPTYKSILSIHDYSCKWGEFEYIIFLHKKVIINKSEFQIYRVYDHEKDALYYVDNNSLKKYGNTDEEDGFEEDHSFVHNQGYIPAVVPSKIIDKKTKGKKSFLNKVDELLREYMRDSSVHSIFKFLFGFPRFWSYAMKCTTCEGTGKVKNPRSEEQGQEPRIICPTCDGKRLQVTTDVSDGIRLPLPQNSDDPKIAPDLAGFITPDLDTWQKQLDELWGMRKDMFFALWGTHIQEEQGVEKTATEAYINVQPVMDVLEGVSEAAEDIETYLVVYQGKSMFGDSFKDAIVRYGRRYSIETPDILWDKYINAKKNQSPISSLDYLYRRFLMAEYHNDSAMLEQKMKEFYLEPFAHYSLEDLKGSATSDQVQTKLLFSEWIGTVSDFSKKEEDLKKEFDEYIKNNLINTENEKTTEVQSSNI